VGAGEYDKADRVELKTGDSLDLNDDIVLGNRLNIRLRFRTESARG
jgi:hypothetical protein